MITRQHIIQQVDELVNEKVRIDTSLENQVKELRLEDFDSLELLDLIAALEGHFEIEFSKEDLEQILNRNALYQWVYRKTVIKEASMDSAKWQGCAFVIPIYNHASSLAGVLEQVRGFQIPVFVVDDGSQDEPLTVAKRFENVTTLVHSTNRGKGAALLTGFAEAAKVARWAITMDADGQHDAADALGLLEGIPQGHRPIVVGCRVGMEHEHVPWTSRFGRGFSNFWVRMSRGPKLEDSQSGFRIYPHTEVLNLKTRAQRFQYEVEVLALAHWNRIPVMELPVSVNYQPKQLRVSHFRPFVDFWRNAFTFTRLIFLGWFLPRATRVRISTRGQDRNR